MASESANPRHVYRGTTIGWPGNPILQKLEITPTTFDPIVATLFALEAANHGQGIVLIASLRKIGERVAPANVFTQLECELAVTISPLNFERLVSGRVSAQRSRELLCDLGTELPLIVPNKRALHASLKEQQRLTPEQIIEYDRLVSRGLR